MKWLNVAQALKKALKKVAKKLLSQCLKQRGDNFVYQGLYGT